MFIYVLFEKKIFVFFNVFVAKHFHEEKIFGLENMIFIH